MSSSQVVVLPIFGTGTGTKVTAGTVTQNYPARAKTDALLTGEWWPVLDDPLSLIDIAVGLPNTLLPVGQFGDATFPTITDTTFTTPAGRNGLLMPYVDTDTSTIMVVTKRTGTGQIYIAGNFSNISGNGGTGRYLTWINNAIYYQIRRSGGDVLAALNTPIFSPNVAIAENDYVFAYMREDANSIAFNYGGSAAAEKSVLTGSATPTPIPRPLSVFNPSIGNIHTTNLTNAHTVAWVGYANTKLTEAQVETIYTSVKALLATAGVTVK